MKDQIGADLNAILACGPRAVGSPGEKACADFLAGAFQKENLTLTRQDFTASGLPLLLMSKGLTVISLAGLIAIAALFRHHPGLSILVLLLPPALLLIASRTAFTKLARMFDLGHQLPSANLIARPAPADPNLPNLILIAHYDSKSLTQPAVQRFLCVVLPLVLYAVLILLALPAAAGLWTAPQGLVLTIVTAAGLIHLRYLAARVTNHSPGAMDNASGVAILLALARTLPARLAQKANLIFLASGAEEMGLIGAFRFVQTFGKDFDPAKTLILNFDSLGTGGKISLVGPHRLKPAGIVDRARTLLATSGFDMRFFSHLIGAGMDHIPFVQNGFTALSFTQTSVDSARRMHSPADRLEYLNIDDLATLTETFAEFSELPVLGNLP